MWGDLLAALALVLVIEGLMPFLSPGGFKRTMGQVSQMPDRNLRVIGLTSMIVGVVLLYLIR